MLQPALAKRAMHCRCDCHWDFGYLYGAFKNPRVIPSDVDKLFSTERHYRFLYFEAKLPGQELSEGQKRQLEALSYVVVNTVIVVWGPHVPETWQQVYDGKWGPVKQTNLEDFREKCAHWDEYGEWK